MNRIITLLTLLLTLAFVPGTVRAEIIGFEVNKIEGLDELEEVLEERFTDDYLVSYADCQLYLEGVTEDPTSAECSLDSNCTDNEAGEVCTKLYGLGICVECESDTDCSDDKICDIASMTCVDMPLAGECATTADCSTGFCAVWDGQFKCLVCQFDEDCEEGNICGHDVSGTSCTPDPDPCSTCGDESPWCIYFDSVWTCVACETSDDCTDSTVCDLSTHTCIAAPGPGACAQDDDCIGGAGSICAVWDDAWTCQACDSSGDCDPGQICQYDSDWSFCATDPNPCSGCDSDAPHCVYAEGAWSCKACREDADCGIIESCNLQTGTCTDIPTPPGGCNADDECGVSSYCKLWDGFMTCLSCTSDTQCAGTTPYCMVTTEVPMCVACRTHDDCSTEYCDPDSHICKEASTTSTVTAEFVLRWSVDSASYSGYNYAVKVGTSCQETGIDSLDDEDSDSCISVAKRQEFSGSYTNIETTIRMGDLIGITCPQGSTGSANVYFYAQDVDKLFDVEVEKVEFIYDYDPPDAPGSVTVAAGENNLKVSWEDVSNNEDVEYTVYWSPVAFDTSTKEEAESKSGVTTTNYQIDGLEIGKTYFVAIATVDEAGNASSLTALVEGTPIAVDDFWEVYQKGGGGEEGGFCFVATAAWGTSMEPSVLTLRSFRDQILLVSAWGRPVVRWYYTYGPLAARFIRGNAGLRLAARTVLAPAVVAAWFTVEAHPLLRLAIGSLLLFGLILVWRRRLTCLARRSA